MAFVAVPTLLIGLAGSRRGSVRAAAICLGSAAYLTYNAVMFCFATPLNQLFLVYVSMLSTGIFVLANVVPVLARSTAVGAQRHVRWVGWWMLLVVGLNGALWLKQAVSAVLSARPIDSIAGTGLTTNPVWVQDLAVWLPVMAWLGLGAVGSLRRRPTLMVAGLFFGWWKRSASLSTSGGGTMLTRPRPGRRPVRSGSSWPLRSSGSCHSP